MRNTWKRLIVLILSLCLIANIIQPYVIMATDESTQEALKVDHYITSAAIQYQSGDSYVNITEDTENIPVDARLKINISYSNIDAQELIRKGGTLSCQFPELFLDISVESNSIQDSSGTEIGTITTDSTTRTATIHFNDSYLNQYKDQEETKISGKFPVYATADQAKVKSNPAQQVTIGPATFTLNFEKDSTARLGEVNILKSTPTYQEEDGTPYLIYKLTVKTSDDEIPDVKVLDYFTENACYVDSYVGVTGNEKAAAKEKKSDFVPYESGDDGESSIYLGNTTKEHSTIPDPAGSSVSGTGELVWNIGDMKANETRTLVYKVRLKDSYIGIQSRGTIKNQARVFSKTYKRDEASASFTPKTNLQISKTAGNHQSVSDGGEITYKVLVTASADNTYTLNNVKLYDHFTNSKWFPYMQYEEDSFKLYDGASEDESKLLSKPQSRRGGDNPEIVQDGSSECKADYYMGDLKPGDQRLIVYKIKINEKIYTLGNEEITLNNVAQLHSDDSVTDGGNQWMASAQNTKTLGRKVWDRKLQSDPVSEQLTVTIPQTDTVYDTSMNQKILALRTFTVPKNSYKYQVVVNESGDWDVSSAVFGDALDNKYLSYQGYLRVDYYEEGLSTQPSTDKEAAQQLQNKTASQTIWVDINSGQKFSLSPKNFQTTGQKGAYLLTYYATPQNIDDVTQVSSGNSFDLSGTVIGPGGTKVSLSGVKVKTSVVIEGGNKFTADKKGWYFDHTNTQDSQWANGSLYWMIDVTGREIPAGTVFRDYPDQTYDWNRHYIRDDSMVGVYVGTLPDGKDFREYYGSAEDLSEATELRKLSGNDTASGTVPDDAEYQWSKDDNYNGTRADITLKKTLKLKEGEHLYIILRTSPSYTTIGRDGRRCDNNLLTKDSTADEFVQQKKASMWTAGDGNNFKEAAGVYERNAFGKWTTIQSENGNSAAKLIQNKISQAGTYIEWRMKINYIGNNSGKVIIEDDLPAGLDLTYVRYFWIHDSLRGDPPRTTEIKECENDDAWQKLEMSAPLDNTSSPDYTCIAYYNSRTGKIRIAVENLKRGTEDSEKDYKSLELQVVTRVTDSEVLLDGNQKKFTNQMTVKTEAGKTISVSTASATVKKTTITKTKQNVTNGKLPFTIEVNQLGEDLDPESDSLTIADVMKSPLRFDPDSIKVTDSNGNEITGISPKIEKTDTGEKMSISVPDNQKLTITYNATLNAPPDTDISVNNKAYWFGHNTEIAKIEGQTIQYHVEAYAGTETKPTIKVKKVDKNNTSKVLEGAKFSLVEVTWDEEKKEWTPARGTTSIVAATDETGIAVFGQSSEMETTSLEYNTVYRLIERNAPSGYVKDSTPYYICIAQKTGSEGQETYPAELTEWKDKGVDVYYLGSNYQCTIYNEQGSVEVKKEFRDGQGNILTGKKIPSVTCRFGIYEDQGSDTDYTTKDRLHTLEITYNKGEETYKLDGIQTDQPRFTGLSVGSKYRVFELDQEKKPIISSGTSYHADQRTGFIVTYDQQDKSYTIDQKGAADQVKITNQYYTVLDENEVNTGVWNGPTWIYCCMTATAILALIWTIYIRIRRSG